VTETATNRERVEDCLERIESGFRRRWEDNEDFRSSLKGKDRDIVIDIQDLQAWTIVVRDGDLRRIEEKDREDPDVRIGAEAEDFLDIFDGDLSPMKAYLTNRVDVSAGVSDLMLVKKFMT